MKNKTSIDLSKFKKVGQTKSHSIFEHPDGHIVHLSHKMLGMAEGGNVPNEQTSPQANLKEQVKKKMLPGSDDERKKVETSFKGALGFADGGDVLSEMKDPEPLQSLPGPDATQVDPKLFPSQEMGAQPLPPTAQPVATQDPLLNLAEENRKRVEGSLEQEKQAIGKQAVAQEDLNVLEGKQQSKAARQQDESAQLIKQNAVDLNKEYVALKEDIAKNPVVPKKMFEMNNTWDRIGVGIGAVIAGLGGNRPENNPVLKMLNQDIDRDLEAQKLNMDQKNNLMSAAFKKFGNMQDAENYVRLAHNAAAEHRIQETLKKNSGPMQQAMGEQLIAKLNMDNTERINAIAQSQALYKMSGSDPNNSAFRISLLPQADQKEATTELKAAENMSHINSQLLGAFDQVDKMPLGGKFSPNQRDALIEPLVAQLSKESAGRFTPADAQAIHSLFPAASDIGATRQIKRRELEKFITQKMSFPTLDRYRIPVPKASMTASETDLGFKPNK